MSIGNSIKNKKGFTLPELLAAVVIIGILSTIAIVSVNNVMKKSHEEYDKKQNKLFTTAAQTYFTDNRSELPKKLLTEKEITLKELIKENYIEKIVDYKKELYNQEESKAYVKKMGRGRYKYYSELVGSDGRIITDKETSKKSSNISVNIDNYDSTETDMGRAIDGVYYVNKILKMRVSGSAGSAGISSWQYKIEKKTEQGDWKKYKSSGEIEVDATEFSDTITINAKDFANGTYKLVVYAYSYDGDALNYAEKESKTIVIDKTKPKCSITMEGTKGNAVEGQTNINWYKAGEDLIAEMNITETNKYRYTLGLDEQTYNIKYDKPNETDKETYKVKNNVVGKYIYGYIQDKAGNVGKCNTEKPIYYDKTNPTCKIELKNGSYHSDTGWYWDNVDLNLLSFDEEQDPNESGVKEKYDLVEPGNLNLPSRIPPKYEKVSSNSQPETTGAIWYGYVEDEAGNKGECKTERIKVDKTAPSWDNETCRSKKSDPNQCNGKGISSAYNNNWTNKDYRMGQYYKGGTSGIYKIHRYKATETSCYEKLDEAIYPGYDKPNEFTKGYHKTDYYNNEQNQHIGYILENAAGKKSDCSIVKIMIDKTSPHITILIDRDNPQGLHNGYCVEQGDFQSGIEEFKLFAEESGGEDLYPDLGNSFVDGNNYWPNQKVISSWWTTNAEKSPTYRCKDLAGNYGWGDTNIGTEYIDKNNALTYTQTFYCKCYYNLNGISKLVPNRGYTGEQIVCNNHNDSQLGQFRLGCSSSKDDLSIGFSHLGG